MTPWFGTAERSDDALGTDCTQRRNPDGVLGDTMDPVPIPIAAREYGSMTSRRQLGDQCRSQHLPAAIFFDRDDTLIRDFPYNSDPDCVQPTATAELALAMVRAHNVPTAVISNQSGLAKGLLTPAQLTTVNARVESLLGPFDLWKHCPHQRDMGCNCRKPRPGMLLSAAEILGVPISQCVMIGDIGADVEAAHAAGCTAVLVPTTRTRGTEIAAADTVACDLFDAVRFALDSTARLRPVSHTATRDGYTP